MEITDILTLSDKNKYMIASKANYNYKVYLCLVNINDENDTKFGYLDNDEIVLVKKEELSNVLLLKLLRNMSSLINNKNS